MQFASKNMLRWLRQHQMDMKQTLPRNKKMPTQSPVALPLRVGNSQADICYDGSATSKEHTLSKDANHILILVMMAPPASDGHEARF